MNVFDGVCRRLRNKRITRLEAFATPLHFCSCRDETPEELALKKEIEELRLKLEGGSDAPPAEAAEEGEEKKEKEEENGVHGEKDENVQTELAKKEKELDDLIRKLDDKVRIQIASRREELVKLRNRGRLLLETYEIYGRREVGRIQLEGKRLGWIMDGRSETCLRTAF